MTTIDTSAFSAQSVWTRFIERADVNGDGDLDREEMEAIDPKADFDKIIAERDANGDGMLNSDELPKGAFSPMLFEQLLNAQEYRDATPQARADDNAKAVAQLFASRRHRWRWRVVQGRMGCQPRVRHVALR